MEKTHDWSLAVRKGNSGNRGSWVVEAEGGCPIHKEGVRQRCRGLTGPVGTRLWPRLEPLSSMTWRGLQLTEMEPLSPASSCL